MPDLEETAKNLTNKEKRRKRRMNLLALIRHILSGEMNSAQLPIDRLFQMHNSVRDSLHNGPRPHYISPEERSGYNYGYMKADEIGAGTPNIWE